MTIEKEILWTNHINGKLYRLKKTNFVEVGTEDKNGYLRFKLDGKTIYNHRYIYEKFYHIELSKNQKIIHINNNKQDNRFGNLKLKTM